MLYEKLHYKKFSAAKNLSTYEKNSMLKFINAIL